jgi:hypothetical protein
MNILDVAEWHYPVQYLLELPLRNACLAKVDDLADSAPSNLNPPRPTTPFAPIEVSASITH